MVQLEHNPLLTSKQKPVCCKWPQLQDFIFLVSHVWLWSLLLDSCGFVSPCPCLVPLLGSETSRLAASHSHLCKTVLENVGHKPPSVGGGTVTIVGLGVWAFGRAVAALRHPNQSEGNVFEVEVPTWKAHDYILVSQNSCHDKAESNKCRRCILK